MAFCKKRRGFSLVELLVVIGIIAVIISLLLPVLSKARASSQTIACAARIRQVMAAVIMYTNESKGYLPPVAAGGNTSGTYGRPDVWTRGGNQDGYLVPYLGTEGGTSGKLLNKVFVCAAQEGEPDFTGAAYNADTAYSYRYHQQLGGDDPNRWIPVGATANRIFVPWKITQISQPSSQAVLIDGLVNSNATIGAIT